MPSSLIEILKSSISLKRYGYVSLSNRVKTAGQENAEERELNPWLKYGRYGLLLCIFFFLISLGSISTRFLEDYRSRDGPTKIATYKTPPIRREWRSLSESERTGYIEAVSCLKTRPSKIRKQGLLYDDFPYIHSRVAKQSIFHEPLHERRSLLSPKAHGSSAFLPWHRYFLHLYEQTLIDECNYNGTLPYWDWVLDWTDLNNSPIFSPSHGFGGNGNASLDDAGATKSSVGHGYCVTDGPFANLSLPFFSSDDHVHCLSRGFQDLDSGTPGHLSGYAMRPEAIENILNMPDYESFYLALEKGPHNAIPNGIRGDFIEFTAPNDPLFFLHHTQLDRTWWRWQQSHLPKSEQKLSMNLETIDAGSATPDRLDMSGFAVDRGLEEVFQTESHLLCYRY